jgi:fucose 4-O-acetylase-like acetyltransferase
MVMATSDDGAANDNKRDGLSDRRPPAAPVPPLPPPNRPPLGLPSGSVRALLTLAIVAVVLVQMARGQEVELLWTETLMIALAHYFTSRRFINLPPQVIRRLTSEGYLLDESRPLYLPQYTIRAILVLAFLGLAVFLYQQGRLFHSEAISILGVVLAYFLGIIGRVRNFRSCENIKAIVVLLVLCITAAFYFADRADLLPAYCKNITLAIILFYFGSR